MKTANWLPALILIACASQGAATTIAITEFMNNPEGEDGGREWVEFYNFGASPVDLLDYTLIDEDSDSYTFPSLTIAPSDFVILVNSDGVPSDAAAKSVFEAEWLGGVADPRVIAADFGALSNSTDELILRDSTTAPVWSLAYGNDEDEDSTALFDPDFLTTAFGTKASPGIDREGDDNGVLGFVGYEDSGDAFTVFLNDADAIKDPTFLTSLGIDTDFYDNVDAGTSEADPFVITSAIPEPGTLSLLAISAAGLLRRRR